MQVTETIAALKQLATTHRGIHEQRIKRELQVTIAVLTLFVAISAFWLNLSTEVRSEPWTMIFICCQVAFISVVHGYYMRSSAYANMFNQALAHKAEDELMDLLKQAGVDVEVSRKDIDHNYLI